MTLREPLRLMSWVAVLSRISSTTNARWTTASQPRNTSSMPGSRMSIRTDSSFGCSIGSSRLPSPTTVSMSGSASSTGRIAAPKSLVAPVTATFITRRPP